MNNAQEQLLQQASNILSAISNTVEKASGFAAEQIPDIAMQYVAYGRVYETAMFLLCLSVTSILIYAFIAISLKNKCNIDSEDRVIAGIGFVCATLISLIPLCGYFALAMLVWVAPKVWLIKEIAHLVK